MWDHLARIAVRSGLMQMQQGAYGESVIHLGLVSSYDVMVRLVPMGIGRAVISPILDCKARRWGKLRSGGLLLLFEPQGTTGHRTACLR